MLCLRREENRMKKINEVSQLAGVSKRTLQYYDDQEVFVVKRTDNNHRLYDEQALQNVDRKSVV